MKQVKLHMPGFSEEPHMHLSFFEIRKHASQRVCRLSTGLLLQNHIL